ncbi:MAG: oligoribonuclease [Actinomycetota bacterium]
MSSTTEITTDHGTDRIAWVDCEMTGLNLGQDALIEIAVVVTNSDLTILDDGIDLIIAPPPDALTGMPEVVRQMHTASGLLDLLPSGISLAEAEHEVMKYISSHIPTAGKAPLAGNSVGTDRGFIARDMPTVNSHLHYRIIDVSSIKELARRWYPRAYFNAPKKAGGHRALADIRESIYELQYYRQTVFVAPPGPDSRTAQRVVSSLTREAESPVA